MNTTPEFIRFLQGAFNAFGAGDMPAAAALLERAKQLDPDHPDVWAGLGAIAWRQGRTEEAVELMKSTVSKGPDKWRYSEELIRALISLGRHAEAQDACAMAAATLGDNDELLNYWAVSLQNIGLHEAALEKLDRAIAIEPSNLLLYRNASLSLLYTGRLEESIEAFSHSTTALNEGGDSPYDLIAAFAELVGDYDKNQLHRDMVERMNAFVCEIVPADRRRGARLLDCGCGTGLFGAHLPEAARKIGIDLSPEMLARAKETDTYDALHLGDMAEKLAQMDETFDIIVSNNAMFYIKDMTPFFAIAKTRLAENGYLLAGFEPCTDEHDIRRIARGNFAHSRAYLRRTSAAAGLRLDTVRIQAHRAYPGFWCVFRHANDD
jgi:predicted TPR repeat methyltransferase